MGPRDPLNGSCVGGRRVSGFLFDIHPIQEGFERVSARRFQKWRWILIVALPCTADVRQSIDLFFGSAPDVRTSIDVFSQWAASFCRTTDPSRRTHPPSRAEHPCLEGRSTCSAGAPLKCAGRSRTFSGSCLRSARRRLCSSGKASLFADDLLDRPARNLVRRCDRVVLPPHI